MTRTRKSLGSWALTAVLATFTLTGLVAGCGGGSKSTPLDVGGFCDQKAAKECLIAPKCGSTPSACAAQRRSKCLDFATGAMTPARQFTEANVAACISKTAAVYGKTGAILPTDLADMDDACNYVFQGTSTGVCSVKYDCAGKKICDTKSNGPLCATPVMKNKDDPCGNAGEICNTGSYCAMDPARGNAFYCLPKGTTGTTCSAAAPCLEALHCDATGHCGMRVMSGEMCVTSDDCPTATAPYCDRYIGGKCDVGLIFAPTAPAACADYGGPAATIPGTGGSNGGGTGGSNGGGTGGSTGSNDASAG